MHSSEWHFTTLLAATIHSVHHLPENADKLIDELLLEFPTKPSCVELIRFLETSTYLVDWFRRSTNKPIVRAYNLDLIDTSRQQPNQSHPNLGSIIDLADWLNVTLGELEWLADIKRPTTDENKKLKHYHYSVVKKRRGGTRLIESPKSLLKEVQRKINIEMLCTLPIHDAAHGYRIKRSCVTHAKKHTGKKALIIFDIANCFQSIQWQAVYRNFKNLAYSPEITKYLTALCTHQLRKNDAVDGLTERQLELLLQRHLPQGAPTSPTLSNLALYRLDKRLAGLSNKLQMDYSRYADDLTFSTNKRRDWRFLEPLVGSICIEEGFVLNHRKSRIIRAHQRQQLTGIIVNQFPNIDRRYYDRLKAILTNCVRFGLESQNINKHEFFYAHLAGSVNYVSTLNRNRGAKLRQILDQITVEAPEQN